MARRLIRLLPHGRHAWYEDGREHAGLPAAGPAALTLLVPGEDVLLLEVARPPGSDTQLAQVLPFAIEDQVIAAIESQHVAWAPARDPARLRVAVVARATLDAWLAPLHAAGLVPEQVLPLPLALPWQAGGSHLLLEGDHFSWRLGECRALSGHRDELPALADAAGAATTTLSLVGDAAVPPIAGKTTRLTSAWPLLSALEPSALNLLQGDYAPRGQREQAQHAWRWAAVLAAIALALPLVQAGIECRRLAAIRAQQETDMAALAQALAPGAAGSGDAAHDLRTRLGVDARDRGLALLAQAAPALAANELQLDSLDLHDAQLELVVQAPDLASLDALRGRLQAAGIATDITGSTPATPGVQGRLRLGGAR